MVHCYGVKLVAIQNNIATTLLIQINVIEALHAAHEIFYNGRHYWR